MNGDKVLVLSPHTDDAELGAGGTISRFLQEGREIYYLIFSGCETSVPQGLPKDTLRKECKCSLRSLGVSAQKSRLLNYEVRTFPEHRQEVLQELIEFKETFKPNLVLIPSPDDMHQDHATVYNEALRAFKKDASIWGYEHPWNNLKFNTDIFVKLSEEHLEKKIRALKEYKSQSDHGYMQERNIRALVYTRGAQLDLPFAEAFELVRLIV